MSQQDGTSHADSKRRRLDREDTEEIAMLQQRIAKLKEELAKEEKHVKKVQERSHARWVSCHSIQLWEYYERCCAKHERHCDCSCCLWDEQRDGGSLCCSCSMRKDLVEQLLDYLVQTI